MFRCFLLLIVFSCHLLSAQNTTQIDSLLQVVNKQYDTVQASIYFQIANEYKQNNPSKSQFYAEKGLKIANSLQDTHKVLVAYNLIGLANKHKNNLKVAEQYLKLGLDISRQLKIEKFIGKFSSNLGNIYYDKGEFDLALSFYLESLRSEEKLKDTTGILVSYITIGAVYGVTEKLDKSEAYFKKALELSQIINNLLYAQYCYNNLSLINITQEDYQQALEYSKKSLEISIAQKNKESIAHSYNSIGNCYLKMRQLPQAKLNLQKAYDLRQEMGLYRELATTISHFAELYFRMGDKDKGQEFYEKAINQSITLKAKGMQQELYKQYSTELENYGLFKKALKYHKLYSEIKDSIFNQEKLDKLSQLEIEYETEKKEQQIQLKEVELEKSREASKRKSLQNNMLIGGLLIVIIMSFISIRAYINKRKSNELILKQKEEVEHQKILVEEKNIEILDSINYAKRIQDAILPSDDFIRTHLSDSFVFYKPKDIVAGDFYWVEKVGDKVLFAVADCTGHGVPGAMISVVCHNALNRAIGEFNLINPGKILDKTREIIAEQMNKSIQNNSKISVRDGMDIALVVMNTKDKSFEFAGANNSLWIIRKNSDQVEVVKATKQHIGMVETPQNFESHLVNLEKGDTIYLFSDGYVDQFGGEKGKKMKTANFKKLLLSIQKETMEQQYQLIDEAFENWKGDLEQLDDVCIIGVRI